jgi:glycosyltransferase involved in cell wall biosynthesis
VNNPKPSLFIVDGSIDVTGALVSASRQAKLLKNRVDTVLVLSSFHRVPAERTSNFAEVITLPFVSPRKKFGNVIFYWPALLLSAVQLRLAMHRRGCERLQLNDFYLLQGAALRLLGFRGRIATFVRIDPVRYGAIGRIWLSAARWSSTEMAAVSRFIQSRLGAGSPTRLIYGQVSLAKLPVLQPGRNGPLFLFVGNYIEGKGQEHAVAAFNRIAVRYPNARLRFVGGDMGLDKNREFRARLEQLAEDGPARDRIEFHGPSNDVAAHYASAFAAINFSESESFSITCLDGSAVGLPVIATRCGGPEEIIEDEQTGFLVPVADVTAMAERMAWLLDHPVEAAAMGVAGLKLVANRFSARRARTEFIEMFGL